MTADLIRAVPSCPSCGWKSEVRAGKDGYRCRHCGSRWTYEAEDARQKTESKKQTLAGRLRKELGEVFR